MTIVPNAEKQGELVQLGGWQKEMARRRYQKGNLRKRGKRNPVWELQWWTDCINLDGTLGRRRESTILAYAPPKCAELARSRFSAGVNAREGGGLCAIAVAAPKSNDFGSVSELPTRTKPLARRTLRVYKSHTPVEP
jgi:hypothetical protein